MIKGEVEPFSYRPFNHVITTEKLKKENLAMKIETVTLINGKNSNDFSVDELLSLIESEEACLDRLKKFKSESKAISKLKAKHNKNIKSLSSILECKVDD